MLVLGSDYINYLFKIKYKEIRSSIIKILTFGEPFNSKTIIFRHIKSQVLYCLEYTYLWFYVSEEMALPSKGFTKIKFY